MNSLKQNFQDSLEVLTIFANNKRISFFEEVNNLAYYGNGGFPYDVVRDMPIYERRINIKIINERLKKQNEENSKESNVLTEDTSMDSIKKLSQKVKTDVKTSDYKIPMKKS